MTKGEFLAQISDLPDSAEIWMVDAEGDGRRYQTSTSSTDRASS